MYFKAFVAILKSDVTRWVCCPLVQFGICAVAKASESDCFALLFAQYKEPFRDWDLKRIKKEIDDLAVFCNYWVKMEESSVESGRLENVSVQIRGKVGHKIPTWCDTCGPWNFETEMALRMNTFEMIRPGNQNADREVSKSKSCPDSLYHKQMPKSWPRTQGTIS